MQILEGKDVDVISPFPAALAPAAAQWARCHKTLVIDDHGPQSNEEIEGFFAATLARPGVQSWGIVDKNNLTQCKEFEVPIVGLIIIEGTPENKYCHILSNRRAWGEKLAQPGLVEQGCELVREETFKDPEVQRLSAFILARNRAAQHLAQRVGFKKDGYFSKMVKITGEAQDIVHFGLVRA